MEKQEKYDLLINKIKEAKFGDEDEIINPHSIKEFPLMHVEPYAQWHGSLNADILVIGQDFSDKATYIEQHGKVGTFKNHENISKQTTNLNLRNLFYDTLCIELGEPNSPNLNEKRVFLTNAVMGLKIGDPEKKGNMNARIEFEWIKNSNEYLINLIEIISPRIIISLGRLAFKALSYHYKELPREKSLRELMVMSSNKPFTIDIKDQKAFVFPMYHCGKLGSIQRNYQQQKEDWNKIKKVYTPKVLY